VCVCCSPIEPRDRVHYRGRPPARRRHNPEYRRGFGPAGNVAVRGHSVHALQAPFPRVGRYQHACCPASLPSATGHLPRETRNSRFAPRGHGQYIIRSVANPDDAHLSSLSIVKACQALFSHLHFRMGALQQKSSWGGSLGGIFVGSSHLAKVHGGRSPTATLRSGA